MEKVVFNTYTDLCESITTSIIEQIKTKPNSLITIAGGDTPKGVFSLLSIRLNEEKINYSEVKFLSLDEWVGLDINTTGSCHQTLHECLFKNLDLSDDQVIFFDGDAENLTEECEKVDKVIEQHGGLDFLVLGIGMNGHLGFNEPNIITRNSSVVKLADVTKQVMAKYFESKLELTHGITLGYEQIISAKNIILMANGSKKRDIIDITINEPISYNIPSTILKKAENFKLYLDVDAAGGKIEED